MGDEQPKFKLDAQNLIKLTLVVVVVSSICFSLFVGITINESNLNGKLRSVKYGAEKKIDALKTDGKIIDYDILDDDGNLLGRKKILIKKLQSSNQGVPKDLKNQAKKELRVSS